jgi:hypothetical protein
MRGAGEAEAAPWRVGLDLPADAWPKINRRFFEVVGRCRKVLMFLVKRNDQPSGVVNTAHGVAMPRSS